MTVNGTRGFRSSVSRRATGRPWLAGLVLGLVVLAAVVAVGLSREARTAHTLGVTASAPVVVAGDGETVCQGLITLPRDGGFSAVRFSVGTHGRPGPALALSVREPGRSGAPISRGVLPAGYPDIGAAPEHRVAVSPAVRGGRTVALCWRVRSPGRVAFFGRQDNGAGAVTDAGGGPVAGTVRLLLENNGRSLASRWPDVARRAAIFRAGWAGPWLSWALLIAVLAGVPALLAVALGRASVVEAGDERG